MRLTSIGLCTLLLPAACARSSAPEAGDPPGPGARVSAQVLAFNDFHGNLEAPSGWKVDGERLSTGGVAYFAAHLDRLRATNPNTVVVSAGDLIGASPLVSGLFHDEPTIEAMNRLDLDINGVGNHELDEGPEELRRMKAGGCHPEDGCRGGHDFQGADFTFLAANVWDTARDETLFAPYEVRDLGGVPVAFIGMTLENTPAFVPPVVDGLEFRDEADTVNALVSELRAEGVEAMVVVVHEGGFQEGGFDACEGVSGPIVGIAERLDPAVDLVVTGHTHQAYNCVIAGRPVTSAGAFGNLITDIDLELDARTGDVVSARAKNLLVTRDVAPNPDLEGLVAHYRERVGPLAHRVVGRVDAHLEKAPNEHGESALGSVIADAHLAATAAPEDGGANVAFMNTGGIRSNIETVGDVTYSDLFNVHPFGNTLVTVTLTGAQLLALLEAQWTGDRPRILQVSSTLEYRWDPSAPAGQRVIEESVRVEGQRLRPEREYRVTVNNYLLGRGVLTEGRDPTPGVVDVDALEAYLAARSPLSPPTPGRIEKAPAVSER